MASKRADLYKIINKIEKEGVKIAEERIEEALDLACEDAEYMFKHAEYDGSTSDIVAYSKKSNAGNYLLVVEGEAVRFIEEGTEKDGDTPYWFYTLKEGNEFGAGGDFAKYKVVKWVDKEEADKLDAKLKTGYERDVYKYAEDIFYKTGKNKGQIKHKQGDYLNFRSLGYSTMFDAEQFIKEDENGYSLSRFDMRYGARANNQQLGAGTSDLKLTKATESQIYEYKYKTGSGITMGNPPNHIMDKIKKNFGKYLRGEK